MAELKKGPHTPGTFCWVEMATRDLAKAKAFYADVLGLDAVDVPIPVDESGTYTMFRLGEGEIGGGHLLSAEEAAGGGHPHWSVYVAVEDIDAIAARAKELGGDVVVEPLDLPDLGRMAVLKDPQSATFGVWFAGSPHAGKAHFPPSQMGSVCWHELVTDDPDAAAGFYCDLFGWQAEKQDMQGTPYTTFNLGDQAAGGLLRKPQEMGDMCNTWAIYFLVLDADAAIATAEKRGGKCFFPPMSMPGVGRFTWIADDQGCAFGILEPPK